MHAPGDKSERRAHRMGGWVSIRVAIRPNMNWVHIADRQSRFLSAMGSIGLSFFSLHVLTATTEWDPSGLFRYQVLNSSCETGRSASCIVRLAEAVSVGAVL